MSEHLSKDEIRKHIAAHMDDSQSEYIAASEKHCATLDLLSEAADRIAELERDASCRRDAERTSARIAELEGKLEAAEQHIKILAEQRAAHEPESLQFDFRGIRDWARFWSSYQGTDEFTRGKRAAANDVVTHLEWMGVNNDNEKPASVCLSSETKSAEPQKGLPLSERVKEIRMLWSCECRCYCPGCEAVDKFLIELSGGESLPSETKPAELKAYREGTIPSEDACVDIFKDFCKLEVEKHPRSISFAWEVGRQLVERQQSETKPLQYVQRKLGWHPSHKVAPSKCHAELDHCTECGWTDIDGNDERRAAPCKSNPLCKEAPLNTKGIEP